MGTSVVSCCSKLLLGTVVVSKYLVPEILHQIPEWSDSIFFLMFFLNIFFTVDAYNEGPAFLRFCEFTVQYL